MNPERIPLIHQDAHTGLSIFFATLCIVDIFGVFPIIALPRTIVQCGLLGIPLVIVVFLFQIYTAALLGESWTIATSLDPQILRKNRNPLAAVTELTLGPRARTWVNVLLDLTVFGCGIPNLLVGKALRFQLQKRDKSLTMSREIFVGNCFVALTILYKKASQNLQLFGIKVSGNHFDLSFCYWLLVVGVLLCPLMMLGSPRDMKSLAICSTMAVGLTAILVWWCIIADNRVIDSEPVPTSPSWDKFISGYGMLAFQFDVHPTLMTVQVDMKRPKDINKAVIISFLISGGLFGVTAGLAVWKYGGSTSANILQIAPAGDICRAAILLSALQLIFSSVIGHAAMFLHLEDELHIQRTFGWKRCAMRSAIVFLGVAVGESVPRFDIVMSLIGGSLTGPLVFVLPPIMYARARHLREKSKNQSLPEILSSEERRTDDESIVDPKAHSRSVYYGFKGNKNDQHRYSYVYYDNEDDDKDSIGFLSDVEGDDTKEIGDVPMAEASGEAKPVIVDPTRPEKLRKKRETKEFPERTRGKNYSEVFINSFGYIVVIIGILITISSTYINVKNTIRFVTFTPPCIINPAVAGNASNAGGI